MYESFTAKNFRCFENLTVGPLERFNLIAGKNNTGKTALLEALWQHHGYHNPTLGNRMNAWRGLASVKRPEFLWDLFFQFDRERTIELSSRDERNRAGVLQIKQREHPISRIALDEAGNGRDQASFLASDFLAEQSSKPIESEIAFDYVDVSGQTIHAMAVVQNDGVEFQHAPGVKQPTGVFLATHARDIASLVGRLSDLAVTRGKERMVEILRIIEPDLTDLTVLMRGGPPMVWTETGMERLMPLPLAGEGMVRLLGIALAVPQAKDGILLVDEIDNGLHYTVLTRVWRAIAALAREYNVQFFATTHSFECIRAAHLAFEQDEQYDFRLHRLDRVKGRIRSVTYDRETLEAALEMGVEVR